jgi:hypothetical protein
MGATGPRLHLLHHDDLALAAAPAERSVKIETGDDEEVFDHYHTKYKAESQHRIAIAQVQREAHRKIVDLARDILNKPAEEAKVARVRLAEVRTALSALNSERQLAELHFESWRAGTRSSVDNRFELRIAVADLPATIDKLPISDAAASANFGSVPRDWRDLWQRFDIGLLAAWENHRKDQPQPVESGPSPTIQARRPDRLTLEIARGREPTTVIGISHHLVVDEYSDLARFEMSKNIFRKNGLEVTFDARGMLVGLSSSSTSALSSALAAAAAAPGAFASGADFVGRAQNSLLEGRRASADAELARLRQDIKQRRERVVAVSAGILPEDIAALQQLERAQSILDAQSKVTGADPAFVGELADL